MHNITCFGKQVAIVRYAIKLTSNVVNKMLVAMFIILKMFDMYFYHISDDGNIFAEACKVYTTTYVM